MARAKIEGGEELIAKLRRMNVDVSRVLSVAAQAGAQVIVDAANPLAPEPIITMEERSSDQAHATIDVGIPDDKWYLKFFETGASPHPIPGPLTIQLAGESDISVVPGARHPGMAAQPFLRPAFDETARGDGSPAAQAVGDEVKKVALPDAE